MQATRPYPLECVDDRGLDRSYGYLLGIYLGDGMLRVINWTRSAAGRRYEYPRYHFCNRSDDVRELFQWACWLIGVECRQNNRWNISVAKRASVALLDEFVGPKR